MNQTGTHCEEISLKLVCATTSGTQSGMQAGEMLVSAHLQESWELLGGKANKVQAAPAPPQSQVPQFQVHISNARFAVGCARGQVMADTFQTFHLLLLFFCCDVFGLKIHQLYQSTTYIHAKPWESCDQWQTKYYTTAYGGRKQTISFNALLMCPTGLLIK